MRDLLTAFLFFSCLLIPLSAEARGIYPGSPDWVSSDTPYSTGAALVDLDRDGWLDLVVSNGNDMNREFLSVYYNRGDGTLPPTPDWQAQDKTYNGHLSVADVDGDGWPDVAVTHLVESSAGDAAAKVYMNHGGVLSSLPEWSSAEKARAFGIAFGDMNNDGRPDLAVATGWAYSPQKYYKDYVYLNQGGWLAASASWSSGDANTDQGALWVDADRDGWLDLAVTGAHKATRVYRNLGGTLDTAAAWVSTDNDNQDAIMLDAGDVTGDGLLDLFVTDNVQLSGGSGKFRQYTGLSGGYYTATPTWSYYEGYGSALALADPDRDGDLDLATGAWWDHARLFFNGGAGLPASPGWSSTGTSVVEKIVFGDVDPTAHTVKPFENHFPAAGNRRLFQLTRRHVQAIEAVTLDGTPLSPDRFWVDREHGWITVDTPPATALEVRFSFSCSLDMAITNWDPDQGNHLYYNRRAPNWLTASTDLLPESTGGTVDFQVDAGPEHAGRGYLLLGSVTGTVPGTPLPGGQAVLPLNWDGFTNLVVAFTNTPAFQGFLGTLDGLGRAAPRLDTLGPIPGTAGITLYFAYTLDAPWEFTSNPVEIQVVP